MSQQTQQRWKRFGPIPGLDPVRETRYGRQVAIEVCGFNILGRFFTERSETSNVSESGCKFCLRTEVAQDSVMALRVVDPRNERGHDSAPVLFQAVRVERSSNQWVVGALKLQSEELWPTGSPDAHGALRKLA